MKHNWKITFYWEVQVGGIWENREHSEIAKDATLEEAMQEASDLVHDEDRSVTTKKITIERM